MVRLMARTKHYYTISAYFGNSGAETALLHATFMYTPSTPPFLDTIMLFVPTGLVAVVHVLITKQALGRIS